jgi:hypothetical protein
MHAAIYRASALGEDEEATCPICLEPPDKRNPFLDVCSTQRCAGNRICKRCVENACPTRQGHLCPFCRQPVDKEALCAQGADCKAYVPSSEDEEDDDEEEEEDKVVHALIDEIQATGIQVFSRVKRFMPTLGTLTINCDAFGAIGFNIRDDANHARHDERLRMQQMLQQHNLLTPEIRQRLENYDNGRQNSHDEDPDERPWTVCFLDGYARTVSAYRYVEALSNSQRFSLLVRLRLGARMFQGDDVDERYILHVADIRYETNDETGINIDFDNLDPARDVVRYWGQFDQLSECSYLVMGESGYDGILLDALREWKGDSFSDLNPNQRNRLGHTPLLAMCINFGTYTQGMQLMLPAIHTNFETYGQGMPQMLPAIQKLLEVGADPNVSSPEGDPVLYLVTLKLAREMSDAQYEEPAYKAYQVDQLKRVADALAAKGADVRHCLDHHSRHFRGKASVSRFMLAELERRLPEGASSSGASSSKDQRPQCDRYGLRSC